MRSCDLAAEHTTQSQVKNSIATLKKRGEFLRLRSGKRQSGKNFTVQGRQTGKEGVRIGYTVTTKVGNAVVRNRIKRRLRQVANTVLPLKGLHGYDYVVIARHASLRSDFSDLVRDFSTALDHIHANGANGAAGTRAKSQKNKGS